MDLFGDLPTPAAKKSSGNGKSDVLFGGLPAAASSSSAAAGETTNTQQIGNENTDAKTSSTAAVAGESLAVSSDKRKASASLVSAVGKAGTSLAFVPQAISQARKKKKFSSQQHQPTQKKAEPNKLNVEAMQQSAFDGAKKEGLESNAAVIDHQSVYKSAAGNSTTAQPAPKHEHESAETNSIEQSSYEEPYLENEPESIRLLHESVSPSNAYNPHFPNDYLAHLERKKTERIQKELQQSALQRLDQQDKLRKKIEEERRKIESSGDVNRIVEMRAGLDGGNVNGMGGAGRGRGRGRGVQNLPAWLIKKQQEQQRAAEESLPINAPTMQGQFGDAEG